MAWIQVHQNLKDHRKLFAAADELEIGPAHMMGLLVSFWLWALDNTPDGKLKGISNRNISRAAQWERNPDELVEALKNAGFLDVSEDGTLEIHDWYEYAGKLYDRRETEKLRSRRRRADRKATTGKSEGQPSSKTETTEGRTADANKTDHAETVGRVEKSRVDKSREDKTIKDASPDGDESAAVPCSKIVELYHSICVDYPAIRNMSSNRRKAIAARWKEYKSLDVFRELFERAEDSPFLKGQNARNWAADFNWLMNSDNMAKVLEGKYSNGRQRFDTRQQPGKTNTMSILAGLAADDEGVQT